MKNPVVRLKLRVRLPDGSRPYLEPVFAANKKVKPGLAMYKGKATSFPEGVYHLRYLRGGRRVWEPVGSDAQLAMTKQMQKQRALVAQAAGLTVVEDDARHGQIVLSAAVEDYLEEVSAHKSKKTSDAYSLTLELFLESCTKLTLEEITRKDVLGFMTFLRDKDNAPRTVANRIVYLKTFFKAQGVEWPLKPTDTPRYVEKAVSAYSAEEIKAMLAVADVEESELVQFFLFTGTREGEVQFATWSDVNFGAKTFDVREKLDAELDFTPKDREEGAIPIPDSLIDLLRLRRQRYPKERLIFTNTLGQPNGHLLRIVKRLGLRAGLNCGHCSDPKGRCCSTSPICERFTLHRFRKTFATMHHEAGVPVRTIQRWLRHSSLETTLAYLAASDDTSAKTREQVNKTFAEFTHLKAAA